MWFQPWGQNRLMLDFSLFFSLKCLCLLDLSWILSACAGLCLCGESWSNTAELRVRWKAALPPTELNGHCEVHKDSLVSMVHFGSRQRPKNTDWGSRRGAALEPETLMCDYVLCVKDAINQPISLLQLSSFTCLSINHQQDAGMPSFTGIHCSALLFLFTVLLELLHQRNVQTLNNSMSDFSVSSDVWWSDWTHSPSIDRRGRCAFCSKMTWLHPPLQITGPGPDPESLFTHWTSHWFNFSNFPESD